jgi:hypothetical protein
MSFARKRQSWSLAEKLEALEMLQTRPIKQAMEKFGASRTTLLGWKRKREEIEKTENQKRRRLEGGGRKLTQDEIEQNALSFIATCRERGQAVTGPLIQAHVEAVAKTEGVELKASSGWLSRFKDRHDIVSRRVTGCVQKLPTHFEPAIKAYLQLLRETREKHHLPEDVRIWNFDETPLYFDMPLATTLDFKGTKRVVVCKALSARKRFTAGLTVSSRGDKLPPFLIFPGKRGNIEHDSTTVVCVKQEKGFMNVTLFRDWIEKVFAPIRSQTSPKEILLLDAFTAHCDKAALARLRALRLIPVFIPGGCTAFLQPLDVSVNKPFKDRFRSHYRTWMLDEKSHTFTGKGAMRAATPDEVQKWVVNSWSQIPATTISKGFVSAGAILPECEDEVEPEDLFLEKLRLQWQSKLPKPPEEEPQ